MSHKKQNPQSTGSRKKLLIILIAAGTLLLAVGAGLLAHYIIHKEPPLITQYNSAMTAKARDAGYITNHEVLIVHTVDDSAEGYITLECYVYQMPEGLSTADMMDYYAHELPAEWNAEQIGTATARMLNGDIGTIYAMAVYHNK